MLLELNISDFAIIERLSLRLGDGFNVLTGETGAGKSIIIDALGTIRGERTDPSFVRAGAERARVEAVFSIADAAHLTEVLEEYGLWDGEEDQIILTRELNRESGRSVARINGRAVSASVLREVGGRLVDIHGQHEGLTLFNTKTHGDMLDRYGGLLPLRERVANGTAAVRAVRDELADLKRAAASRAERIDELQLLLEDVRAAKLSPGEEADLLRERAVVQNGARISDLIASTYGALYGAEDEGRRPGRAVIESLGAIVAGLGELAKMDPWLARAAEQAGELLYTAEDLAATIRSYRDTIDLDTGRLDAIEDRMTLIREIQRKHRGSIEQILERAAAAEAEIDRLTHSDERLAELESQEYKLLAGLGKLAGQLSQQRRDVGDRMAAEVEAAVRELAMPHVRFFVGLERTLDIRGVPVSEQLAAPPGSQRQAQASDGLPRYAFDKTGIDAIEFLLSPNPGEPLKPLAKIASGGESARLLLALKSILSKVDEVPTLIFDEVDVGVGGRAGHVVGEKLWSISGQHQVVCITHLPQVASFADSHYHIAKSFDAERTRTTVRILDDSERTDEIAAMLDGTPVSEHSRSSAREMLDRARSYKQRSA